MSNQNRKHPELTHSIKKTKKTKSACFQKLITASLCMFDARLLNEILLFVLCFETTISSILIHSAYTIYKLNWKLEYKDCTLEWYAKHLLSAVSVL